MKRCPECRRDYYDDSLLYCLDDGSALLEGPASGNEPATAILHTPDRSAEAPTRQQIADGTKEVGVTASKKKIIIITGLAVLILAVGYSAYRYFSGNPLLPAGLTSASQARIKSLAVLPLRPLDASDNYIGMGIADAIIRRISQTGELTVRPTSAIRRYLNDDTDALTAAKQLNTDAVLEGSIQRADDRLRVSVNLLRTTDGASLWNDNFDLKMTDIFTIQDTVSRQVASRLSLKLDPSQQVNLTKRYTSDPTAYEYYQKAMFIFDSRLEDDKERGLATIDILKKAIDADPNYALAHAQLAYVYAEMATFDDPTDPKWAPMVNEEIERATQLDPQLAEIHLARYLILWSSYGGYQTKAAIRELLLAQQLNPNVGHAQLGELYSHVGLVDLSAVELKRASEIDPTSDFVKSQIISRDFVLGEYDEWLGETRRQYGDADHPEGTVWYLLGKGRLDDAEKQIAERSAKNVDDAKLRGYKAILFALKGNYRAAEAEIPGILSKQPVQDPYYHHITFDIASIYALEGKSEDAVKWLRKTAEAGYPCYPRFERDPYFDRIRQTPEFVQFMAEMKQEWETYKIEFGEK